jgi:replicative DNA helicase
MGRDEFFDINEEDNGPEQTQPEEVADQAAAKAVPAGKGGSYQGIKFQGVRDVLKSVCDDIRTGRKPVSYNTSFDRGILGLAPSRVVVLGGGAGTGKTSLGMSCLFDVLYAQPAMRAVVCNVEMTAEELLEREMARLSGVSLDLIQGRTLTAGQQEAVDGAHEHIQTVEDRLCIMPPPLDPYHIEEAVEYFRADLLLVDYLQELDYPEGRDRRLAIDDALRGFRRMKRAGKCVLVISEVTAAYAGTPAHLKESGQINYEADNTFVLEPARNGIVTLKQAKGRRGTKQTLRLRFLGNIHRWESAEQVGGAA